MKSLFSALPYFAAAFVITAVVIASLAAISVLGDNEKALYFDKESASVYFFGEEYVLNQSALSASKAVFDFNGVFLGENLKNTVEEALKFCIHYALSAFGIMFGVFERIINNCV